MPVIRLRVCFQPSACSKRSRNFLPFSSDGGIIQTAGPEFKALLPENAPALIAVREFTINKQSKAFIGRAMTSERHRVRLNIIGVHDPHFVPAFAATVAVACVDSIM